MDERSTTSGFWSSGIFHCGTLLRLQHLADGGTLLRSPRVHMCVMSKMPRVPVWREMPVTVSYRDVACNLNHVAVILTRSNFALKDFTPRD